MSERNGSTNTNTSSICRRQAAFISRASKRIKSQRSYYPSYRLNSTHTPAPIEHHLPFLQLKKLCCLTPNGWEIHSRCRKRKLELQRPMDVTGVEQAYPDFLRNLLYDTTSASSAQFRVHIRSYNSTFSFASLGAKIYKKNASKIKNNKLPYDAGNRSTRNAMCSSSLKTISCGQHGDET